ncbi:hypothetical protein SBF1_2250005 [Candidatus Desulfosporosinus infrequens]|uniref:Uncharacterized protein n=1 Tax=Candidatus Desulfosporosinus infrequens TaxID=2043169 RepID=A0A2U3KLL8_9FIRM|nr:hypothetical protein SBF1_2250005 [Candidatus Desulfosporosinus infrequens]
MKLILKILSTGFLTVGKLTDKDLIDAHGRLLLAKGEPGSTYHNGTPCKT